MCLCCLSACCGCCWLSQCQVNPKEISFPGCTSTLFISVCIPEYLIHTQPKRVGVYFHSGISLWFSIFLFAILQFSGGGTATLYHILNVSFMKRAEFLVSSFSQWPAPFHLLSLCFCATLCRRHDGPFHVPPTRRGLLGKIRR